MILTIRSTNIRVHHKHKHFIIS